MDHLVILLKNIALSTLHGWVGASLAVFMFFRPLKPWRIGRIKIWQGVIPAQQVHIAGAISEVVAKELITPQALHDYLVQNQAVERQVEAVVHNLLSTVVDNNHISFESIFPPVAAELRNDVKELAKKSISGWLEKFLNEPDVNGWFEGFSQKQLNRLYQKKFGELFPEDKATATLQYLLDSLSNYLSGPEFKDLLADFYDERYHWLCGQTIPLGEVLPGSIKEKIYQWPAIVVKVLPDFVKRLQNNEELLDRVTAVILENMERLKEKGLLARIGIDLYQFLNNYRTDIRKFVRNEIFPRLSAFLSSPEVQDSLEKYIKEQVDSALQQPLGEFVRGVRTEQVEMVKAWLIENSIDWLKSQGTRTRFAEFLLERYRVVAGLPVAELAGRYPGLKLEEIKYHFIRKSRDLLRQPVTVRFMRLTVRSLVEDAAKHSVGRLRDNIPRDTLEKIETAAVGLLSSGIKSQIPSFLNCLDLKGIVQAKIEGYSPKELVDMFQRVTMNNMQKIEIYGAVIGALMGVFFGLANLREDAFWFITGVLVVFIGLIRYARNKD